MSSPTWSAPTQGATQNAGQINQFLTTHPSSLIYAGTSQESGAASATANVSTWSGSAGQFIAQQFTTGSSQTTITRIAVTPTTVGGAGADITLGLYTNNAGVPGTLVGTILTCPLEFIVANIVLSMPYPVAVTASTTYFFVIGPGTTTSVNFEALLSGTVVHTAWKTATSIGGPWTTGGTELLFNVYAGTSGNLIHTYEDSGAKWTAYNYSGSGSTVLPNKILEYTAQASPAQAGAGRSSRTINFSSGQITSTT